MTELKSMIYIRKYVCPYCGYSSDNLFPIEHYEGGSSGYRTFRCPHCGKELREELTEESKKWIEELTRQHHQLNDGYETTLERNFEEDRGCSILDDGRICDICHTLRWIKMFF